MKWKKNAQKGSEILEHYHWHYMDRFLEKQHFCEIVSFSWITDKVLWKVDARIVFVVAYSNTDTNDHRGKKVILKNLYDFFRIFLHRYPTDHCF